MPYTSKSDSHGFKGLHACSVSGGSLSSWHHAGLQRPVTECFNAHGRLCIHPEYVAESQRQDIASKLDSAFKLSEEECRRLRAQYKCQEDDRDILVRQVGV
jgi:hypothetical protein